MTRSTHKITDGITIEVHGYMNVITREVFELKSKVWDMDFMERFIDAKRRIVAAAE